MAGQKQKRECSSTSSCESGTGKDSERRVCRALPRLGMSMPSMAIQDAITFCGKSASLDAILDRILSRKDAMEKGETFGKDTSEDASMLDLLLAMGYPRDAALRAIDNNPNEDMSVLVDALAVEALSSSEAGVEMDDATDSEAHSSAR